MSSLPVATSRSARRTLVVAKRRAILHRLVESNQEEISFDELAELMRQNTWVAENWPKYSAATARNDFNEVMSLVEDDMRRMAHIYLSRQLGIIERTIDKLEEISEDPSVREATRVQAMNAIGPFLEKEIRLFGNYPDKNININKKELKLTLADFKELRKRVEDDIIDGETVDTISFPLPSEVHSNNEEEE